MARLAAVVKNNKRIKLAKKWGPIRKALREKAVDVNASDDDKMAARKKLMSLPRNTSPSRVVTRCYMTGRARAVYRKFGLARMAFREMALTGKLPGVTKASW